MIGIVVIILGLVYLGRILSLAWGQKPLGPDDFFLLVPLMFGGLLFWLSRALAQRRLSRLQATVPPSFPLAVHDVWRAIEDEEGDLSPRDKEPERQERDQKRRDEEEQDLRRTQEFARQHWWGNR